MREDNGEEEEKEEEFTHQNYFKEIDLRNFFPDRYLPPNAYPCLLVS